MSKKHKSKKVQRQPLVRTEKGCEDFVNEMLGHIWSIESAASYICGSFYYYCVYVAHNPTDKEKLKWFLLRSGLYQQNKASFPDHVVEKIISDIPGYVDYLRKVYFTGVA